MATRRTCTLLRKFYNGRCLPVAITVDECWRTPDGLCLFRWGWGLGQQHLAHRLLRVLQSSMIVRSSLDNLQLLVCFGDYGLTRPAEVELAAIGMGSTVGYIYIYIYIYICIFHWHPIHVRNNIRHNRNLCRCWLGATSTLSPISSKHQSW